MDVYWVLGELRHYAYRLMLFAGLAFLTVAGALPYFLPPEYVPPIAAANVLLAFTVVGFVVGAVCSLVGWLDIQYGLLTADQ